MLANVGIGWIGANVKMLQTFFSPERPPGSGNIFEELAKTNVHYLSEELPHAVMDGLAEKQQREKEAYSQFLQDKQEQQLEQQFEQQPIWQRITYGPPTTTEEEIRHHQSYDRREGKDDVMNGMGVEDSIRRKRATKKLNRQILTALFEEIARETLIEQHLIE